MESKLKIWNQVCKTDPSHTKKANAGKYDFTAVDPAYQLHEATKLWGPYGTSWGLRECHFNTFEHSESRVGLTLSAEFYYPGGKFEIFADMPYRWNDDALKKLLTAARSKALSLLGFNADVYVGQYDDDRYVSDMRVHFADEDKLRATILGKIRKANDSKSLAVCKDRLEALRADGAINLTLYSEGLQVLEQQEGEIAVPSTDPSTLPISEAEQELIREKELAENPGKGLFT